VRQSVPLRPQPCRRAWTGTTASNDPSAATDTFVEVARSQSTMPIGAVAHCRIVTSSPGANPVPWTAAVVPSATGPPSTVRRGLFAHPAIAAVTTSAPPSNAVILRILVMSSPRVAAGA
jgi:hypothetical protein